MTTIIRKLFLSLVSFCDFYLIILKDAKNNVCKEKNIYLSLLLYNFFNFVQYEHFHTILHKPFLSVSVSASVSVSVSVNAPWRSINFKHLPVGLTVSTPGLSLGDGLQTLVCLKERKIIYWLFPIMKFKLYTIIFHTLYFFVRRQNRLMSYVWNFKK